ncbi:MULTISPECIES: DUF4929 family protein [Myroides]|uniref:DUF4929 domain-containing protein n=1 Tax=Myroides albus TaxID=2562892 RepID=A0A6I3LGT5_9FLAO|nr:MULTISPECIES: DUF4929 family protein [Myroides]MTG97057.1 DUF4929 domain-containing protein [Myroides albus]MVX36016.1 DUF4929 domain-containing protein [Myroides sp. LoEW2-1]UVD78520.1 DUF4929 domain-containing protein [Myroides albus]
MKHYLTIFTGILLSLFTLSCTQDDNQLQGYTGENRIVLQPNGTHILQDNSTDEVTVNVFLVNSITEAVTLEFALENNTIDGKDILTIENPIIQFAPKEKKAQLKIKSSSRQLLSDETTITIKLINNTSKLPLDKEVQLLVTPIKKVEALTDKQIELLDGYKRKGLDLYPLMGEIKVNTTINFPGGANLETMYQAETSQINGITTITLSDKSTPEQPVLKMVSNPMGIEGYLYKLQRLLTIDDNEFWTQVPASQHIMNLINLSATSKETFEVELDDIYIDLKTRKLSYTKTFQDIWGDDYTIVPFQFKYSAWDRLKKLLDEGNPLAIENTEMGGTVNPSYYLNNQDIQEDYYDMGEGGNYRTTSATLTDTHLNFQFIIGHEHANDYILFTVEYKLK